MKLIFTLIVLFFSVELMAQPGTLDKTFGDTGFVTNPAGFYCANITVQPDKKILAGSESFDGLTVIRYLSDGSIDYDFGDSGLAIAAVPFDAAVVAVTGEGKILAAAGGGSDNGDVILVQFTTDGKVDSSFGINGISTIDFGKVEFIGRMQLQPDGKIVVAGRQITDITNPDTKLFIARFNADGSTDESFGHQGIVVNDVLIDETNPGNLTSLALESDGKIVAGATTFTGGANNSFILWKYNTDGSPDKNFGINGTVVTDFSQHEDDLFSLAVQPDDKIIAGGIGDLNLFSNVLGNMLFIRYNPDGSVDRSFGDNGATTVKFENLTSLVNSVLIDNNGNIIGVGNVSNINTPAEIALARLTSDGIIDSSFGTNGIQTTPFSGYIYIDNAVLQGNKIIAGNADYLNGYRPLLARYNNDLTKRQIIIKKIKHYIQTHNDAQATMLNNVFIYPNPAQNILHVEGLSSNAKLTVVDFNGNVIVSRELSPVPSNTGVVSNGYDLNVSSLHAGNYLLKIETNGEVVTKQFVKE